MKQFNLKSLTVYSLFAVTLGAVTLAQAQESNIKIGYVSLERILSESKMAKEAQTKMQGDFSKREKDVRDGIEKIKSEAAKLDKEAAVLPEAERVRKQRELAEHDRELQRKQRELIEDSQRRGAEERAKIFEKANQALKQIVEQKKLDLVVQDAAFVSPKIDITNEVIQLLNR